MPNRARRLPAHRLLLPDYKDGIGETYSIPEHPPSFSTLKPVDRKRAKEIWVAANRLYAIIDEWRKWANQLRATGDADPGLAGRYRSAAVQCIDALCVLKPSVDPFAHGDAAELKKLLPPVPSGCLRGEWPSPDGKGGFVLVQAPPWQQDKEFLGALFDNRRDSELCRLQRPLYQLRLRLTHFPNAALGGRANNSTASVLLDSASHTVWLGDRKISVVHPHAYAVFERIYSAKGKLVTAEEIRKLPSCKGRIDRLLREHLRPPLRKCIRSKAGRSGGYWFRAPANKSMIRP
jgi:hypothetical protein